MSNFNKQMAFDERMPHTISPSSSMLRCGPHSGDNRVSYCKRPGHEKEEIEGACYQCADTFCKQCMDCHKDHTVIFFKDCYIKNNYEWFQQIPIDIQGEAHSAHSQSRDSVMPAYLSVKSGKTSSISSDQTNLSVITKAAKAAAAAGQSKAMTNTFATADNSAVAG